jgi:exopolysaccharide biosynthesis polyprenyl glycosylphosphotransferase
MPKERQRRTVTSRLIATVTMLADLLAMTGAFLVLNQILPAFHMSVLRELVFGTVTVLVLFSRGLYEPSGRTDSTEYARVLSSLNLALLFDLVLNRVLNWSNYSVDATIGLWLLLACFLCIERFLVRRARFGLIHIPALRQRTLIVGVTDESRFIAHQWADVASSGVEAIGFIDDFYQDEADSDTGLPVLGSVSRLDEVIKEQGIDSVLIARPELIHNQLVSSDTIMRTLSEVEVFVTTGIGDLFTSTASIREEAFVPLVVLSKRRMSGVHLAAKTVLDYVGSLIMLALTGWIMMVIAILVKLDSPGPIIYRHRRIGLNDKVFYIYKFRSMYMDGNSRLSPAQMQEWKETMKIKDDPRVTKIGNFLRKSSLDELPQLFNVLRGEMSWVGPRPIVEHEAEKFGQYRHIRSMVKPGLTGLWQVSGRSDVSYDERVNLDTYYVRNHTIWLDLEILFKTVPALLARRGAY